MIRILLAAAAVIGAGALDLRPGHAAESPWCAVIELGTGSAYWDCQYATLEKCVPKVIAGNRGSCNPNPAYHGQPSPVQKARRKYRASPG